MQVQILTLNRISYGLIVLGITAGILLVLKPWNGESLDTLFFGVALIASTLGAVLGLLAYLGNESSRQLAMERELAQLREGKIDQNDRPRHSTEPESSVDAVPAQVHALFSATETRLLSEVSSLTRRSNVNLLLGIVTTGIAMVVMAKWVFWTEHAVVSDWLDLTRYYGTRLSLVIFIEVFAYFFLRQYRTTLMEIKYFQNERTNIEMKHAALATAIALNLGPTIAIVIQQIGATERNSILKKDETTAEIEKAKGDSTLVKDLTDTLNTIVAKVR